MDIYRQGDVMLVRLDGAKVSSEAKRLPPDKEKGVVLAYGEVTGHAHALDSQVCCLYNAEANVLDGRSIEQMIAELGGGSAPQAETNLMPALAPTDRVLEVRRDTALRHNEHAPIDLKEGLYFVRRQREYDPDVERLVAD